MRPYDRYENAEATLALHELGSTELSGQMSVWDQLDLSLYCSVADRFNARQRARATIRLWSEQDAVEMVARDFRHRQRVRRAALGPIEEPRQLGKKR